MTPFKMRKVNLGRGLIYTILWLHCYHNIDYQFMQQVDRGKPIHWVLGYTRYDQ